ncbi:hypothetical protein KGM_215974 [Danaus plexippus plexippus]|uniref:Uncharacterized protein n=1 Tax=Danaus plexippus plexippus TaxID=278856 RepID=A0A212ESF2_DANPL|nr:hypothetical protein KGM_215974 [Danaus plexippus plexippus]
MIRLGSVYVLITLVISVVKNETEAVLQNYGFQTFDDKSWRVLSKYKPLNTFTQKYHVEKSNRDMKAKLNDVLMMKLVSYYENKYALENNGPVRAGRLPLSRNIRVPPTKIRKNNHIKFSVPEVVII